MAQKTSALLPSTSDLLSRFGERLRLARLRRGLTAKQVAERAGMAPMTLRGLERGGSGVTMGAYLAVMQVLGIESDLELLGRADPVGRELQDAKLPKRARARAAESASRSGGLQAAVDQRAPHTGVRAEQTPTARTPHSGARTEQQAAAKKLNKKRAPAPTEAPLPTDDDGFIRAEALAGLIEPMAPPNKRR